MAERRDNWGYAKVIKTLAHASNDDSNLDNVLQWCARRGEEHSDDEPCIGTSIKGRLHLDGRVRWKKEILHTGGYTEERRKETARDEPLVTKRDYRRYYYDGEWFGFKVIIYNINNDEAVKMEAYFD